MTHPLVISGHSPSNGGEQEGDLTMLISAKITNIEEPETVSFKDGTQHRRQHIWLNYQNNDTERPDNWNTILTLWDSNIDQFQCLKHQLFDTIEVDMQLSYKTRQWNGRTIYETALRLRSVELMNLHELPAPSVPPMA